MGKQNLKGVRKCSGEWRFCSLFYTLEWKEEPEEGYVESAGDGLRGWDWIKPKRRHILFFTFTEELIINFTARRAGMWGASSVVSCALHCKCALQTAVP